MENCTEIENKLTTLQEKQRLEVLDGALTELKEDDLNDFNVICKLSILVKDFQKLPRRVFDGSDFLTEKTLESGINTPPLDELVSNSIAHIENRSLIIAEMLLMFAKDRCLKGNIDGFEVAVPSKFSEKISRVLDLGTEAPSEAERLTV